MKSSLRLVLVVLASIAVVGCGRHDHAAEKKGGGHAHTAPHGGALIEVGEHAYNLELLRDSAAGKLTVWVLDGHAENFVRIKAAALEATATVGSEKKTVSLKAVANLATGETVGDTSQFEAQADWLKGSLPVEVTFAAVEIKGRRFEGLSGKAGVAVK
ncbi:MAG: hypothetical protein ACKODK_16200 [Opitutaceae bacterium]